MDQNEILEWLGEVLPKHELLLSSVIPVTENLLRSSKIDYLAVTGRVKTSESIIEKIKRKSYKQPNAQMTDVSGVRVIVFLEADVAKVSKLINSSFSVDSAHSSDKKTILKANQTGYRSVHFVCDLGAERGNLPEYNGLGSLKFEFQIRTVLQHAWAELAHDSNYKFSGKLPPDVERKLFLYAGMLEIADKGFDELSREIDIYKRDVHLSLNSGDLNMEINSINLVEFIDVWARKHDVLVEMLSNRTDKADLVEELREFGIENLDQLEAIIPDSYASKVAQYGHEATIYGIVRDWMLISDWRKYRRDVSHSWELGPYDSSEVIHDYLKDDISAYEQAFSGANRYHDELDSDFV